MSRKKGKGNRRERGLSVYSGLWDSLPWEPDRNYPHLPPQDPNWRVRFPIDYTFVHPRVATGGGIWDADDMATLRVAGITHIVTAATELEQRSADLADAAGMPALINGVDDDGKWKPVDWFATTAAYVEEALAEPASRIYLHCWSGKNRGPVSAYVALRVMGMGGNEAEAAIRRARPKVILLYLDDADAALEALGYGRSDRRGRMQPLKVESPRPAPWRAQAASGDERHRYSWLPKGALAEERMDF